jgi:hypothetical protein
MFLILRRFMMGWSTTTPPSIQSKVFLRGRFVVNDSLIGARGATVRGRFVVNDSLIGERGATVRGSFIKATGLIAQLD